MVRLDSGNVLLKPSHRKRLMGWLRRAERLGEQIGDFVLNIQFHRKGRRVEIKALVHDAAGDFSCRCHARSSLEACRHLVAMLSSQLHDRRLALATA
jgi:hypothetical protein